MREFIDIRGARENNLKNVSLRIPKRKITIFTGVSGSGKSSIVFDTIASNLMPYWIEMSGIGLLNEKPLHASLKQWYARPGDRFEVAVGGFVIDIVRDDLLIEIQTGNFAAIKSKLSKLAHSHRVRLVYPIAQEKWIIRSATDDCGRVIRRKSPRRGRLEDLFWELVSIPQLLSNRNFSLEVLMIKEEEARRYEGKRRRRRGGWAIEARRLLEVLDRRLFMESADWRGFLPEGLESFTSRDLATAMDMRRELAQKMAYCLRKGRVIELIGKQGRSNLYRVAGAKQMFHRSSGRGTDEAPMA